MTKAQDQKRIAALRALTYQASREGLSAEELDERLQELYRPRRAAKAKG